MLFKKPITHSPKGGDMNIEAIQKAYKALEKEGVIKNPKKAFRIKRTFEKSRERTVLIASIKYAALIDVLRRELELPSFFATFGKSASPIIVGRDCENLKHAREIITAKSAKLSEFFEIAHCFL